MMSSLKDPPSYPVKPNASLLLAPIETSPSPHDVSDIILSFFGPELADSKDQLSRNNKDISDSTASTGALAIIGEEKKPTDPYQEKLDLYMKLEHQIQQAIAKQLAEKESQLKTAQERYPNFNNPHLLQEPCPISQFLDERALQEEGLLVSSDYRREPSSTHVPPHREWPTYLESTVTSKLHAKVQSSLPHKKSPIKLPPVWKNSLSSEEREIAKKSLVELYRKTDFPRNLKPGLSLLKKREKTSSLDSSKKKKKVSSLFIAEPSKVFFTDYTPGKTYESVLVIKNISEMSQQMSITSPRTPYFQANLIEFPSLHEGGIIAPGMSCSYSITFSPNSLADFSDEIKVMSHIGKVLSVPLVGYRSPPILSLPMIWELGHCLVKGSTVMTLVCTNTGGDGNFQLTTTGNTKKESLSVGPFTITPTVFSLTNGQRVDIKVTFEPQDVSEMSHEILMICDNGQETVMTLKGTGEMVDIGCISVNPVSSSNSSTDVYIDDPVILFQPTNPCIPVYHTVLIKNSSNVSLSYEWKFYHPRTEYTHADGSKHLSSPIPYSTTSNDDTLFPFSVDYKCDVLSPKETKSFTFCFLSNEIDCITDVMAYFELLNIPRASLDTSKEGVSWISLTEQRNTDILRIATICINLQGQIEPYAVNFSPPIINLPVELSPCTETRRKITINNNSWNDIKYEWMPVVTPQVNITVEPNTNVIAPGEVSRCQLIIQSTDKKGSFNVPLQCTTEHSETPFILPVKGNVKGPEISVDSPCIEFGLVEFGTSVSETFQFINHSLCSVNYELRQIIITEGGQVLSDDELLPIVNYECLDTSPCSGELIAKSSVTVTVNCSPNKECGHLRTAIECLVEGDRICILGVTAEIQRPMLLLANSSLNIDISYTTVPIKHTLTLINITQLHTHFQWINESRTQVDLRFSPECGPIGPHERVNIELETTWKIKGEHTGVMAVCCARGMDYPVMLSLSAHVLGLSVNYTIQNSDNNLLDVMNFGACNQIRQPKSLLLTITNNSAVTGSLIAFVRHFPSTPSPHETTTSQPKSILQSTNNLAKESSKTKKKRKEELISHLLSDGRGACFTVEPSELILSPFQSQLITVTCYADMWGQYNDILTCKVYGIDAITIPIQYSVTSTPIYFQPTATYDTMQVRLGCHPAGSNLVRRTVTLTNVSSTVIRINWKPFYIDYKDDKIIDLISYIGHPFPTQDKDDNTYSKLVRVHMFPHEGKPSKQVFGITPNQIIMEPHSATSVEVTFDPSIAAYNEIGEQINGYILGYLTIDNKSSSHHHINRVQGYDMRPARMNISASITHPRLNLKTRTDNNNLNFYHLASEFFLNEQVITSKTTKSHYFSLLNHTLTSLSFHILPMTHNKELMVTTSLTPSNNNTNNSLILKPSQSIEGSILVSLTHQKLLELIVNRTINDTINTQYIQLTDTLTVLYSTGAKQEFPLSLVIILPSLSAYPVVLDFGTCLIDRPLQSSFQLRNNSKSSPTKWTITVPKEWMQIVQVDLLTGTIESTPQTITVTFTPKSEIQYSIALYITDEITHDSFTVTVTGIGSADEKYKRPKRKRK